MNILITGASGLIGTQLSKILKEKGHTVSHLSRTSRSASEDKAFVWDIGKQRIEPGALDEVDVIVNLAGAGIADKRWSAKRKRELLESRTMSVRLLHQELAKGGHSVRAFISASAMGYYGLSNDTKVFTEDDPPGTDFLADVTRQWEGEIANIAQLGIRTAFFRIGIVLSRDGGALKKLELPVQFCVGASLGKGTQPFCWIHSDDLCSMFVRAIEHDVVGPFNAVAPNCSTNESFTRALAGIMRRPLWVPNVPAFALRLYLGEMAGMVLNGIRLSSKRIVDSGFQFKFDTLEKALTDLYYPK